MSKNLFQLAEKEGISVFENKATTSISVNAKIDTYLDEILPLINEDDLLIITADHGCDPTVDGTDHTREYVPVLYYSKNIGGKNLGLIEGFDSIAKRVEEWLGGK